MVLLGRNLPEERLRMASAALAYYMALLLLALTWAEPGLRLDMLLFEAVLALSTVGLSMGLTGGLGDAGKLILILLMYVGRVGILTFGLAFALRTAPAEAPRDDVVM